MFTWQVLDFFGVDPTKGLTDTQVSLKVRFSNDFLIRLGFFFFLFTILLDYEV